MSAEKIVENSWTAAFSSAVDGSITAWNRSAERLLAAPRRSVVCHKCYEVIAGRDVFGNDYCSASCASWKMAVANRPIRPYRLIITDKQGRDIDVKVSVLVTRGATGPALVHLLEPVAGSGLFAVDADELEFADLGNACPSALTRRELQVLRRLAAGSSTNDITTELRISRATVRNHISRCLKKLDVHSRVEAVGLARRLDLV